MSFLRKLFGRGKQPSQREVEAQKKISDLDSGYVFVSGLESLSNGGGENQDIMVASRLPLAEEDPTEVDVSAWEMARHWTANTKNRALSQAAAATAAVVTPAINSKSQRLAHRVENIRKMSLASRTTPGGVNVDNRRTKTCVVVNYIDPAMDEDTEYLFDDKWNRKSKVESRRDRSNRLGT
ncbi:LAFA_0E16116g1_1 [Lachancea sp. 'fantastica']|nr:LAFA_0E16116g1_1 [Lachancea sp. 'fantastica']